MPYLEKVHDFGNNFIMSNLSKMVKTIVQVFGFEIRRIPKQIGSDELSAILIKKLDLSIVEFIRELSIDKLRNVDFCEKLLLKLGLNDELLDEFPQALYQFAGKGLFSWQYPNQFSKLLVELSKYPIGSYLEIGVRHGGTFVIICEYLKKVSPHFKKAVALDLLRSDSISKYSKSSSIDIDYFIWNSQSDMFRRYVDSTEFDLVYIDGDHSLEGCRNDFNLLRDKSKMIIFHDIASVFCPGVCATWQHFKSLYKSHYDFIEFIDQYDEVYKRTGKSYLGIGLAVKKGFK